MTIMLNENWRPYNVFYQTLSRDKIHYIGHPL